MSGSHKSVSGKYLHKVGLGLLTFICLLTVKNTDASCLITLILLFVVAVFMDKITNSD